MTSLFDDISQFDEGFRIARRQAVAVAHKRVQDTVGAYLRLSKTTEERAARLDYVSDDIRQIVADTADEFSVDHDKLLDAIHESLEGEGVTDLNGELADAPSAVGEKTAGGHKPDCGCGFCKNKGKLPGAKDDEKVEGVVDDEEKSDKDASEPAFMEKAEEDSKESSTHVADAPRDGGGATKTVSLPKGDGRSIGTGASPKIDKKEWKPNALNADGNLPAVPEGIEMDGTPNPNERQDLIDEDRDYERDFDDKIDAATTSQDLPSGEGDSFNTDKNISQEGQMGSWTETQNSPVTDKVFASFTSAASAIAKFRVRTELEDKGLPVPDDLRG